MKTELTITADGETYPVEINDDGMFRVDLRGGNQVKAPSLEELQRKARKVKTAFTFPFTQIQGRKIRHGTITGIHASSGNLLVLWDDGEREQMSSWQGNGSMTRLTDAEADELRKIREWTYVHAGQRAGAALKREEADWNTFLEKLAAEHNLDIEFVRQLDFYAEQIVDAMPPPSERQRVRLANLLASIVDKDLPA
jgi:hypothetical protein